MVKTLLIVALLTVALGICASTDIQAQSFRAIFLNPNVYRTRTDLTVTRISDDELKQFYDDKYIIKVDRPGNDDNDYLDYKIIQELEDGTLVIKVLPKVKMSRETSVIKSDSMINTLRFTDADQNYTDVDNAYRYYFSVDKADLKPFNKTLLSSKIVGVPLIHPVKYRPGKGIEGANLSSEFTVSYVFGLRLKLSSNPFKQNFITIVPYGFGLGVADYFTENLDKTLTEKTSNTAITYYQGGVLFTIQKVNFGLFAGFDAMISKKNDWFYQSQPWLSFGLGYKFKTD